MVLDVFEVVDMMTLLVFQFLLASEFLDVLFACKLLGFCGDPNWWMKNESPMTCARQTLQRLASNFRSGESD
jgi:hypothetical protein